MTLIAGSTVFSTTATARSRGATHSSAMLDDQASGEDIHPVFGFSALSPDTEPPVEPDHEVQLLLREPQEEGRMIPEFFFEPTGLAIEPGETVQFTFPTPEHTVTAYHPAFGRTQRVPDGVPQISSPVLGVGAYWLYQFTEEGVYDLFCAPHELLGMAMRLVVGEPSGPGAEPVPAPFAEPEASSDGAAATTTDGAAATTTDGATATTMADTTATEMAEGPPLRPPELTSALVLRDPALAPEAVVEATQVSWEDIKPENKRLFIQLAPPQ